MSDPQRATTPSPAAATPADVAALTTTGAHAHAPQSFLLEATGRTSADLSLRRIADALRRDAGPLWVDIDTNNRHQVAILEKVFGFHPLAVEDVMHPNSRVKVDAYDGYVFITVRVVRFCEDTDDPYDLETVNLYLFIGGNYLVTAHAGESTSVGDVLSMVRNSPDVLARGPARLAHLILDAAIDAYFPIIDRIDEYVDGLEERVFSRFDDAVLQDIFSLKRMVLQLRRFLAPQREVFNILTHRPSPFIPAESQLYFRDVYDHMLRINDSLETYRDLLGSTLDSYLTQVSNRLGSITKGLSVIATLSVPFVVVSGMWGMNFVHIPLAGHPYGFWLMLALQLGMGGVLVWVLRRIGLL